MAVRFHSPAARLALAATAVGLAALAAGPAAAVVQDEIQVYNDDINKPGEKALEIHVNTTPSGRSTPDFPGEVVPNHGLRITPEWSYGLGRDLELGLYTPLVQRDSDGDWRYVGSKLRLKWLPWQVGEGATGWYGGVNSELSRVGRRFEQAQWATELRPILGYEGTDWNFAFNPIFDWDLSGPTAGWSPELVPSFRLVKEAWKGVSVGAEYYSDLGRITDIQPWNRQDNRIYGVVDLDLKPYALELGIGRGITDAADKWTVKAILEVPLDSKAK